MVIPKYKWRLSGDRVRLTGALVLLLSVGCSGREMAPRGVAGVKAADNAAMQKAMPDNAAIDNAATGNAAAGKGLFLINGNPVGAAEFREFVLSNGVDPSRIGAAEIAESADQLINNRLLAAKAVEAGIDKNEVVRSRLESNLNRLWKDTYWNYAVKPGIKVPEKEIWKHAPAFEEMISIQQLVVPTREKAAELRAKAIAGGDFDKIIEENSEGLTSKNKGKVGYIKIGSQMYDPELVKSLFKLKTHEYSPVVSSPIGFSVIRVIDRKTVEQGRKEWFAENRARIAGQIESDLWKKRLDKLVASRKVKLNKPVIDAYMDVRKKKGNVTGLLAKPAFSIDGVGMMVGDLVDPSGMGVVHGEQTLELIINKRAEEFAIAREIERLKLKEKAPEIALKERTIRESILAREYINYRCRDVKVTPAELKKHYDDNPADFVAPRSLVVSFIETRSKSRLDQIYAELKAGKPFAAVADEWSDNKKFPGGKSGAVPESRITPEFAAVKSLKPGEYLKSPIVLKSPQNNIELYVIARLDEITEKGTIPFEKANKDTIEKALVASKREAIVKAVMADLRKNNKVEFTPEYDAFRKTFLKMTSNQRGAK